MDLARELVVISFVFNIAGTQFDDKVPRRAGIRVSHAPGGQSSGIW